MDAGTVKIANIFGKDIRYLVPLFQRPYVWERGLQWEPLWDDIRLVAERLENGERVVPHFLGAIVLDQVRHSTGHLETRWVIDGQQRLTTIQLLMEAFADICEEQNVAKFGLALRKLTRNDDPMSEDPDEELKVWPTNTDQDHFRRVMYAENPEIVKKDYGRTAAASTVGHPIADGYLYFHDQILGWLQEEEATVESRVPALYSAIREHVRMVVIDLSVQDDPQLIFETLNARGTPLLPSDLVKNFLFHRAKLEGRDLQPLYDQYWQPFDAQDDYWRKELGRGHARRARIDHFLQYYLTARTAADIPVGRLYGSFREYAIDGAPEGVRSHLQSLQRYAEIYQSFDHMDPATRAGLFFERLRVLGARTAYPFLLELFSRHGENEDEIVAVLQDIESFLVRRMVGQMNTRGYNRLFVDLIKLLDDGDRVPSDRVREFLLRSEAESRRWPRDDEFRHEWLTQPLYRRLAQSRVRLLLEGIERALHTGMGEKIAFTETLTIEHVMPQNWQEHWPLPDDPPTEQAISRREELLHTIGNLTLLTGKLNPSLSNGQWPQKREGILRNSLLNLNLYFSEQDQWSEERIRVRGEQLFETARAVWPCPEDSLSITGDN